jgi:hypothetical protein
VKRRRAGAAQAASLSFAAYTGCTVGRAAIGGSRPRLDGISPYEGAEGRISSLDPGKLKRTSIRQHQYETVILVGVKPPVLNYFWRS